MGSVDFALPAGQVHALSGPVGDRKSLFVGMVPGRFPVSRGKFGLMGGISPGCQRKKRMRFGMVNAFQITAIYAGRGLHNNIALALRRQEDEAVAAVLGVVGLEDLAEQFASDLSCRRQRLLEIAVDVAQSPRSLIVDGSTLGGESDIAEFNGLIRSLAGDTTILQIEHNVSVVMALSDDITVLGRGKILASGAPNSSARMQPCKRPILRQVDAGNTMHQRRIPTGAGVAHSLVRGACGRG